MMLSLITICLTFLYVIFITWCHFNWIKIGDVSNRLQTKQPVNVAVIIPVRNEKDNLKALIDALADQSFPKENFNIIVVDDHSSDGSFEFAEKHIAAKNIRNGICLRSPEHLKKNAISFAVKNTEAELIITTDGDTTMGEDWIASIVTEYVEHEALLICGPVKLIGGKSYFEKLQSIEFAGLSGIAAAGITSKLPMMCNGANLAFSRKIFNEVNGFAGSKSQSGDDTQLLLKINSKYPGRISFLKDKRAIVETHVLLASKELLQQRKRWASKIPTTLSFFTVSIAVFAWFVHAFLLIQFFNVFFFGDVLLLFLPLTMKIISEIFFLKSTGKFYDENIPWWIVISVQPLYCVYIVVVGLLSPFGTFKWKGREAR